MSTLEPQTDQKHGPVGPGPPTCAGSHALLNSGASADVYSIAESAAIVKFCFIELSKVYETEGKYL